jgi:hypothetical protein
VWPVDSKSGCYLREKQMNKATAILHFVPAAMLVLAIGRWPYGYYMLLRVIVLATALLLASLIYQQGRAFTVWIGLFVAVAFVYNPLVPLHLTRGVWSVLNLAVAVLFIGHFIADHRTTLDRNRTTGAP